MSVVRRFLYRDIATAVLSVTVAFVGLFFFFDLIDELSYVGRPFASDPNQAYELRHALFYVSSQMPNRVYDVLPIAVLIGSVFVFAKLAQNSEFTILRTSGLGPWLALRILLVLGGLFVCLTFVVGDYLAPATSNLGFVLKARFEGRSSAGPAGAWIKEKRDSGEASVNVRNLAGRGQMEGVRIFEYDGQGWLLARTQAESATIDNDGQWTLQGVDRVEFLNRGLPDSSLKASRVSQMTWPSTLTADMVSVALLHPDRMSTLALYGFIQHLGETGQSSQLYELEFWRKVFYPLSCLVMMVLALPFAYLHFRSGSITGYVFGGVMIGISFFLLNNVFGFIGRLHDWVPWMAAASPSLIYSVISLTAFGWLVLRR